MPLGTHSIVLPSINKNVKLSIWDFFFPNSLKLMSKLLYLHFRAVPVYQDTQTCSMAGHFQIFNHVPNHKIKSYFKVDFPAMKSL